MSIISAKIIFFLRSIERRRHRFSMRNAFGPTVGSWLAARLTFGDLRPIPGKFSGEDFSHEEEDFLIEDSEAAIVGDGKCGIELGTCRI